MVGLFIPIYNILSNVIILATSDNFPIDMEKQLLEKGENPYPNAKEEVLKFRNLAYEYLQYRQIKLYEGSNLTMASESDFYKD